MSGQHCENYDVKRETVHCYPRNVDRCCMWSEVTWCGRWNLSAFLKLCFCFVLLYNKSLYDWSLGNSEFCFPLNIEILGKQNSLFPSGPVILNVKCLLVPSWHTVDMMWCYTRLSAGAAIVQYIHWNPHDYDYETQAVGRWHNWLCL